MAEEPDKIFDPEKHLTKAMTELENALNTLSVKVKEKREELEEKGLDDTVKETVENIKVGSKAIADEIQEDAKRLKKNIEEILKEI